MQKKLIFSVLFTCFSIYSIVVYTIGTSQPVIYQLNEKAKEGKLIFQKHNCIACHQIYGLGGYIGPELTTIISKEGNDALIAKAILKTGTSKMPDFKLNENEIECLIEFFKNVNASAITYTKS